MQEIVVSGDKFGFSNSFLSQTTGIISSIKLWSDIFLSLEGPLKWKLVTLGEAAEFGGLKRPENETLLVISSNQKSKFSKVNGFNSSIKVSVNNILLCWRCVLLFKCFFVLWVTFSVRWRKVYQYLFASCCFSLWYFAKRKSFPQYVDVFRDLPFPAASAACISKNYWLRMVSRTR